MEIIENIKEKCGKDYPVLYRMSAVEYVPGGLEIEESKILARLVEEQEQIVFIVHRVFMHPHM